MSTLERIAWVVAALAFIPALVAMGGFVIAALVAGAVLSLFYGGRYGLRVYEQRQMGAKATQTTRNALSSDSSRWKR